MKEEFNLSERIEDLGDIFIQGHISKEEYIQGRNKIDEEFIRILLDTYEGTDENWIRKETIIKLAGKELK